MLGSAQHHTDRDSSDQYDVKLQMTGLNTGYDQVITRGLSNQGNLATATPDEIKALAASGFALFYFKGEKLLAADAVNRPKEFMVAKQLLQKEIAVNKEMVANDTIEAKELFDLQEAQIETVIHPESLIHALVGFSDGALMAHVGPHAMRHAIGCALNWPTRKALPVERLDLAKIGQLNFRAPDHARYPALAIAQKVMDAGGLTGAVFNAAKEHALDSFIAGDCGFTDMARVVDSVVDVMLSREGLQNATITLDSVQEADRMARALSTEHLATIKG